MKKMRKEIFISLFPSDWKNFHSKSISTSSTRIVTRFYQKRKKSSSKQSKIGGPNLMISVHWAKETTNVWFSRRKSRQAAIPSVGFWMKVMRMNLVKRERRGRAVLKEKEWRMKRRESELPSSQAYPLTSDTMAVPQWVDLGQINTTLRMHIRNCSRKMIDGPFTSFLIYACNCFEVFFYSAHVI